MKVYALPDGCKPSDYFHVMFYQVKGLDNAVKEAERLNSEKNTAGSYPHPFMANVGWLPEGLHPNKHPLHVVAE